ncbi:hypothetical protein KVV02_004249 [Mortierella alpina]|uniref:Uncharacterized protein n=1 Tax=Mortierella alpina TaxID=64518 RepID=A0A9P7ZX95_MORAP|nr:hypothetical protein KVV02_004249 [Mortierella alpina]
METLMECVEDDKDWIQAAPQAAHGDSELLHRASLALQHPLAASQNEDSRLALRNLQKFGLATEMSVAPGAPHFVVLTASNYVPFPMEIQQAGPHQYTNPISPATFRDAPRKNQARAREDDSTLTGPVLKRAFARAFNDFVEEQIEKGMAPIMKRQQFKRGETRESKLAELKDATRLDLESRDQVPRGSYTKVMDIARSEYGLSGGYRLQQLRSKVEAQSRRWTVGKRL